MHISASAILSTLMQELAIHLRSWFAAMCLVTAASCSTTSAQEAWIIELAPLPGDTATQPASGTSIAQSGVTQVGNSISATARQRAIRSIGGVVSPLGVLPGLTSSVAAACSLDGSTIVGFCIGGAPARAFTWVNGVMSDLGTPPVNPAILPRATCISASGAVIGGTVSTGSNGTVARGWIQQAGVYTMIPLPEGSSSNPVRAISGDGRIAVGDLDRAGTTVAFAWSASTNTLTLPSPPASGPCSATATNDDASIVLGVCGTGSTLRAIAWVAGQPITLPPLFPADTSWQASTLSADGGLIGGQSGDTACVWSLGDLRARSIEDLLALRGVDLSAWKLFSVTSVSPDGQFIAGSGEFTSTTGTRSNRAWLARIPSFCPTDWNADGGLDGADVGAFYESWEAGTADLNLDGGTDGYDIEAFFERWSNGEC